MSVTSERSFLRFFSSMQAVSQKMFLWVFTSSAHSFTGFECARIRTESGRSIAKGEKKNVWVSHLELFPNELRLAFCFGLTSQKFLPCIFCGGGFLSSIFALPDEALFRSSRMFLLRKRLRCFCLRRTEQTRGRSAP